MSELIGDAAVELSRIPGALDPAVLADPASLSAETFATISGVVACIDAFNSASSRISSELREGDSDVCFHACAPEDDSQIIQCVLPAYVCGIADSACILSSRSGFT